MVSLPVQEMTMTYRSSFMKAKDVERSMFPVCDIQVGKQGDFLNRTS